MIFRSIRSKRFKVDSRAVSVKAKVTPRAAAYLDDPEAATALAEG